MKNRLQALFQAPKKDILSIFFTAGYPHLVNTEELILQLDAAGADLLEVGFPFSDSLVDGPVIQESNQVSLKNGMSLKKLFQQLEGIREKTQIPILLMGYLNPVLQYGEEKFMQKCADIGIDGFIIPDMPLPYYNKYWATQAQALDLSNILLITPETEPERIKEIDLHSTSFIYMVSSNSITGANKDLTNQTVYFERINQMNLQHPRLVGFGIHNKETFRNACKYSSGAIIGSAFIKHLKQHDTDKDSIQKFIKQLR